VIGGIRERNPMTGVADADLLEIRSVAETRDRILARMNFLGESVLIEDPVVGRAVIIFNTTDQSSILYNLGVLRFCRVGDGGFLIETDLTVDMHGSDDCRPSTTVFIKLAKRR
jgi:hypothetical protein